MKKSKKKIPSFKVVLYDINRDRVEFYDVMPYFISAWSEDKKRKTKIWNSAEIGSKTEMPKTFEEFKDFVMSAGRYKFWARCEYEVIVSDWPNQRDKTKIDAFDQIEANIDVIAKLLMEYVV